MTPEKDAALSAKYPKIFPVVVDASPPMWGFECGDGWWDIIDTLAGCIQHEVDVQTAGWRRRRDRGELTADDPETEEELQVVAAQVKEKFGGLRFYTHGASPRINGMISVIESLSHRTCEDCGVPGTQKSGGWIRTLCEPCHATDVKTREERWKGLRT